ncbi:hypothetical protein AAMO2058_000932700 [Amorphochlora amoebiformis]
MADRPPCAGESLELTDRVKLNRSAKRGTHVRKKIYEILDSEYWCTVSYGSEDGNVYSIPQLFGRSDDYMYLHSSVSSSFYKRCVEQKGKLKVVLSVTVVDGLVLARSMFHHSLNYRSVVIFADEIEIITDRDEKMKALHAVSNQTIAGRWEDKGTRIPVDSELASTGVFKIRIEEASAKIRHGPPGDDRKDMKLNCWAGVVPQLKTFGQPQPDDETKKRGISPPEYVRVPDTRSGTACFSGFAEKKTMTVAVALLAVCAMLLMGKSYGY